MTGNPLFQPCTPYGVMKMLERTNVDLKGKEVVVVGGGATGIKFDRLVIVGDGAIKIAFAAPGQAAIHTRRLGRSDRERWM